MAEFLRWSVFGRRSSPRWKVGTSNGAGRHRPFKMVEKCGIELLKTKEPNFTVENHVPNMSKSKLLGLEYIDNMSFLGRPSSQYFKLWFDIAESSIWLYWSLSHGNRKAGRTSWQRWQQNDILGQFLKSEMETGTSTHIEIINHINPPTWPL